LIFWHQKLSVEPWDTIFHMTSTMHVVFALYMFILGVSVMCNLLKDGRRFAAFLAYWSWFSILVYSYAGEKVPWLLMHVLMPMILLSSVFMNEFLQSERFRRRRGVYVALITIGLLLFLQASIRLCFFNEANPNERMVYTQTSMDIKKCVDDITYWAGKTGKGYNFPLGVQGESTWPFSWYLRDYKQWFHPGSFTSPGKEIVIADWTKRNDYKNILEPNYKEQRRRLRVWWVPDPVSTLKNPIAAWLKYYFRREPWNPTNRKDFEGNLTATGSQDIVFCVRNDLLGEQLGAGEGMPVEGGPPTPVIPEKYAIIGHVNPALCFGELGSTEGKLNQPRGIWVDEEGMIYVADTKNHRWQKFDQRGNCLITVGREGKEPTEFKEPMGIAVDGEGNIYVADTWNHRIQKFDREGNFIKLWPGGEGGFWAPKGMAFDSQGYLYVVDTGRHRVQKFTREGNFLLVWGDQGEGKGQFKEPVGIVIERDGIIQKADVEKKREQVRGDVVYVTDTANKRVQKFDTNGKFLGEFGVLGWEEYYTEPFIALDGEKRLWLTDSRNNRVEIFDTEGTLLGLWSSKGFRPGDFNIPIGIFIRDDTIYITDTYNNRIQLFPEKLVMK
jgi:DNA-binding beta-propeller fold protein YncE